ncbi:hypothetical protein BJV82DRAFT_159846 [Fennellomyces sp. T-0311]|nr:hypothetical protein BJV82DRAFT_159846 [Fennellomyces sp. T-0311]
MSDRGEREPLLSHQDGQRDEVSGRRSSVGSESQRQERDRIHRDARFQIGRFTWLEKILFTLSVALLILLCVFVGLYARRTYGDSDNPAPAPSPTDVPDQPDHGKNDTKRPVCVSAECVLTAAEILKDIDTTVDPCDDFFAYTCNNWIKTHDMPEGKSRTGSFDLLATRNKEVLHNILTHDFDSYHQQVTSEDLPDPDKVLDRQNFNKSPCYHC